MGNRPEGLMRTEEEEEEEEVSIVTKLAVECMKR
jgi:hypothetical protein